MHRNCCGILRHKAELSVDANRADRLAQTRVGDHWLLLSLRSTTRWHVGLCNISLLRGFEFNQGEMLVGGSKCLITYPTYTIYHMNMIPEIRAIPVSFLILSLKSGLTMAEFDYLRTILIVKRSEHNTKRLISFQ